MDLESPRQQPDRLSLAVCGDELRDPCLAEAVLALSRAWESEPSVIAVNASEPVTPESDVRRTRSHDALIREGWWPMGLRAAAAALEHVHN
jgi:hypothetical protein